MENRIKIPEKIRKKMRKKNHSLFPFPFNFPLKEKIEVPTLRFIKKNQELEEEFYIDVDVTFTLE